MTTNIQGSGEFRVEGYGRVDRSRTLTFTFDGRTYSAHPGDTVASALLAHGVRRVGTSVKLGRPRGISASWTEDATGLVQVEEPFPEPMLLAGTVEVVDGLVVRGLNGRGRLAEVADTARYDRRHHHVDTLVVGAGPAGLLAARAAARRGERVALVDDRPEAGGSLTGTEQIDGTPARDFVGTVVAELAGYPEVLHLQRTTAFGHYDDGFVLALERRTDHLGPDAPQHISRQRVHRIRAREIVVAAGAHERPIVFADNDRPGIMLAGSARDLLHRHGVLAGRDVVVFTSDDAAYAAAADLADAGARVQVVEARATAPRQWLDACRRRGIAVRTGSVVVGTEDVAAGPIATVEGEPGAAGVTDGRLRSAIVTTTGGADREEVGCDLLLVSGGWNPAAHLFSHVRGPLAYDPALGAFRPTEPVDGVRVIGAANGTLDLAGCLRDGTGAGQEPPVTAAEPERLPTEVIWRVAGPQDSQFVDVQRDSTVADIGRAIGAGMRSVEHVKRYTTIGTAHDQGKTSGVIAAGITADLLGARIEDVGTTTFRPPYTPVAFAALAGRERGSLFDPERVTAVHDRHVAAGAVFDDVGQWKRARYYPAPGEDMEAAVLRECTAARNGVGILDGSTLGKIDVQGPDAAVLLDRVYTNMMSTLKVGRVRYGVMCGNDGMVIDDGTVLRLGDERFMLTTTTGGAAPVLDWLEEWVQTEWPELRVHLTSVTEQWAVFPVVGPRSRDVLAEIFPEVDFGAEAFPFMSWRDAALDAVPVRIARISFSGELAYEVNVSSWYARSLWELLLAVGAKWDITPYGTEAMHVLRAEKGYPIIGQDTDGTVTPHDLGMSWAVSKKKDDFIGKRSFSRPANLDPMREQFVGLLPTDARTTVPEGSQIIEFREDGELPPPPVFMLGHVTSSYRSAELGRPFALALVKGGRERVGDIVHLPVGGRLVPAEITSNVLVDPEGARRDG